MNEIKLFAHGKLNLSLELTGRREDGYHNIRSLMQGLSLCDEVRIKKCLGKATKYNLPHCTINGHVVYLCTSEKTIPTDLSNLALKGISVLADTAGHGFPEGDLLLEIDKKLPVAAGIAGGSANAAAAMLGMNALMGMTFSLRELMDMGTSIGADVPFSVFMNAYRNHDTLKGMEGLEEAKDAAAVAGIGDIVKPVEPVLRYVIIANPGIKVPTREVYEAMDRAGCPGTRGSATGRLFVNDLERYTLEKYEAVAELKQMMQQLLSADEVLMSGSGPTIAAYYKDEVKALKDADILREELSGRPDVRVWNASTGLR